MKSLKHWFQVTNNSLRLHTDIKNLYVSLTLIIALLCFLAGTLSFVLLQNRSEEIIKNNLFEVQDARSRLFSQLIRDKLERAEVIAKNFLFAEVMQKNMRDYESTTTLYLITQVLADTNFSGVSLESLDGKKWQSYGSAIGTDALILKLNTANQHELLWDTGLYLRSRLAIKSATGDLLGHISLEQPIALNKLNLGKKQIQSANIRMQICGLVSKNLGCLPEKSGQSAVILSSSADTNVALMRKIITQNITGVISMSDKSNQKTIVAYGPVGDLALGMTMQMDADQLFAPIFEQVKSMMIYIVLLLMLGMLLLRLKILPIVRVIDATRQEAVQNANKFKAAVDSNYDAFLIFDAVNDGETDQLCCFNCTFANEKARQLLGHFQLHTSTLSDTAAQACSASIPYYGSKAASDIYLQVLKTGESVSAEFEINHAQIQANWLSHQIVKVGNGVAITVRNISAQKKYEAALIDAERFQSAIVDSASYALIAIDVDGNVISANKSTLQMTGYTELELKGKNLFDTLHDQQDLIDDAVTFSAYMGMQLMPGLHCFLSKIAQDPMQLMDSRYVRKDGSSFPVKLSLTQLCDNQNKVYGHLAVAYDITEQKRAEDYIKYMALHDMLTDLPNRILFDDRLSIAIEYAKRDKSQIGVALLDIDRFKNINDTFGHEVGDSVLKEVALRLSSVIRPSDTLARIGGDEFALLLPATRHPEGTSTVMAKIMKAFEQPIEVKNLSFNITCSAGVCSYPQDGQDLQALLLHSDTAMYRVKESGRNNFNVFSTEMGKQVYQKMWMEAELRKAIQNGAFELYYQPQIDLNTNQMVGVESLLRWKLADGTFISPAEFIPLAEETGLIIELGEWVIETAIKQAAVFAQQLMRPLRVSVNISAKQFKQKNLTELILNCLQTYKVLPENFEVEITESILIPDLTRSTNLLDTLHQAGVQIALDDFGTGYSSLSYLSKFPIDRVKIDQSFVRDIHLNAQTAKLTNAIVNMAKSLQLKTVAEGVETQEELDFMRALGCDEVQGYLFDKPMAATQLIAQYAYFYQ